MNALIAFVLFAFVIIFHGFCRLEHNTVGASVSTRKTVDVSTDTEHTTTASEPSALQQESRTGSEVKDVTTATDNSHVSPSDEASGDVTTTSFGDDHTLEADSSQHTPTTHVTSVDQALRDDPCTEVLCVTTFGFLINTSLCTGGVPFQIIPGSVSTSVNIWTDPAADSSDVSCEWTIPVQRQHHVVVTFDQVTSSRGAMTIDVLTDSQQNTQLDLAMLSAGGVSMTSTRDVFFVYSSRQLGDTPPVTFHVTLLPNLLPSTQLSNSTGVVTSPGFGEGRMYPIYYDGIFDIFVPENYSVLAKFTHFNLETDYNGGCQYDFVTISEKHADNDTDEVVWKDCGSKLIPMHIFRNSFQLRLVSDSAIVASGFRMVYTTLPKSQEPAVIAESIYNCSVSQYDLLVPLVQCNGVVECSGNEDEEDCAEATTTSTSTVTTSSPVLQTEDTKCTDVICPTGPGLFYVSTSLCYPSRPIVLNALTEPTTVQFGVDPQHFSNETVCRLNLHIPRQHHHVLVFHQLLTGHVRVDVVYLHEHLAQVDSSQLRNGSVNMTSIKPHLDLIFWSHQALTTPTITFQLWAEPNILPSGRISESAGFVTSPNFGLGRYYPNLYDGTFDIAIPEHSSVLIKVAHMSVSPFDFVQIYETNHDNDTKKLTLELSGYNKVIPLISINSSIHIRFKSDDRSLFSGFKMIYAVVPTHELPVLQQDALYDCSVPHSPLFMPVFRCNAVQDCQGMEDERDCSYSGLACGAGAIEAERKCYTLTRTAMPSTWYSAQIECMNHMQSMVTLDTPEDFRRWEEIAFEFDIFNIYVGFQLSIYAREKDPMSALYRNVWKTFFDRAAFTANISDPSDTGKKVTLPVCAYFMTGQNKLEATNCFEPRQVDIICESRKALVNESYPKTSSNLLQLPDSDFGNVSVVSCPTGHMTRDFLSCDSDSQCQAVSSLPCQAESLAFPMFSCDNQDSIPYTLVCDFISHCSDNSDENFCIFESCGLDHFTCGNQDCIQPADMCDGKLDCTDGTDEICELSISYTQTSMNPPAIIDMLGNGTYTMIHSDTCPPTHFRCLDGYCLPVYLRCNGISDCTSQEDEGECDSFMCPGYYRCRGSKVCLHPDHMCDGVFHCPQYDDESLCQPMTCPDVCQCRGLALTCTAALPADFSHPQLRYLDVSHTQFIPQIVYHSSYLITLRLSHTNMSTVATLHLTNLRTLDLSDNEITAVNIQSFSYLTNLRVLILKGNPLKILSNIPMRGSDSAAMRLYLLQYVYENQANNPNLIHMDLSDTHIEVLDGAAFASSPLLKSLNISHSRLRRISDAGFRSTPKLKNLDLSESHLTDFPPDLLRNLSSLQKIYTDNYILCCEAMLPVGFDRAQCYTEESLLTSCEDLLRTDIFRIFLWTFATLAVVGNVGSFVGRVYISNKDKQLNSFNVFVTNLSLADLFMGVYLTMIGVADQVYLGEYLWHSRQWKSSVICSMAGFLSLLSSEVSAFIICLITLDRLLVLRFPFSYHLHFQRRSAVVASGLAWLLGVALASVPLLPATSHWRFYSQTGICLPLPFSSGEGFPGRPYSLAVMIVLNFVLFLLIAAGQLVIYISVRSNTMASSQDAASKQARVARRLTSIVVSDFLCWFPIGLLGLLASAGVPIPGEVNVGVAIFVLPLNSALNPFLYTFNMMMEKKQKAMEERLLRYLEKSHATAKTATVSSPTVAVSKVELLRQLQVMLENKQVSAEELLARAPEHTGKQQHCHVAE